jgi:hypothetical protein
MPRRIANAASRRGSLVREPSRRALAATGVGTSGCVDELGFDALGITDVPNSIGHRARTRLT